MSGMAAILSRGAILKGNCGVRHDLLWRLKPEEQIKPRAGKIRNAESGTFSTTYVIINHIRALAGRSQKCRNCARLSQTYAMRNQ